MMEYQPSVYDAGGQLNVAHSDAEVMWDDSLDGDYYASGDTDCRTTGTKTITLNADAIADFENALSNDWFAIGHHQEDTSGNAMQRITGGQMDIEWDMTLSELELKVQYVGTDYSALDGTWNGVTAGEAGISGTS